MCFVFRGIYNQEVHRLMGKFTTYLLIMSGLMLMFYFTGLIPSGNGHTLLDILLHPDQMPAITLATLIKNALLGTGLITAIAVGFYTKNYELAFLAPIALFIIDMMWGFLPVIQKVYSVSPVLAVLLFGPVMFIFLITGVDWWRGREN